VRRGTRRILLVLAVLLLAVGIASAAIVAMREPFSLGDYASIYGLKARALFRSGSLASLFRIDPEGEFSHPEYPPLWPLVLASFSGLSGRYDDLAVTPLWPILVILSAVLAIRATRGCGTSFRVVAGAAAALLPYWRRNPGYAEGLFVVFVLAALGEADAPEKDRWAPVRLAFFLTLAAWTKAEGVIAALAAAAVLLAARRVRTGGLVILSVVLLSVLPWALLVSLLAPHAPPTAFSFAQFSASKVVAAVRELIVEAGPGAGWLAGALLLLVLAPETRRRRSGILAACGLYSVAICGSFGFTRIDAAYYMYWAWDRLVFIPAAVLLPTLAEALAECFGEGTLAA
jgi:hypothetical protein